VRTSGEKVKHKALERHDQHAMGTNG
jgi:hypothetical protein